MSARVSKAKEQAEREQKEKEEQKTTQHEPHVEVNKEKYISQANTKPII